MKTIYNLPKTNQLVESTISNSDQDLILIGAMAELTEALLNRRRGRTDNANIGEDLSHVIVGCEVMRKLLFIEPEEIEAWAEKKLINPCNYDNVVTTKVAAAFD